MERSLFLTLWWWYRGLNVVQKVVYPLVFIGGYCFSVLLVVAVYWLKTDMGYNLLHNGGWHTVARCMATGLKLDK